MTIAVSYERVSSEMQLEGYSLSAQHAANLAFIERKGWRFGGSYRDEAASARTTNRPAFQRMLADAEAGLFHVIVVHKLDRFSRSVPDTLLTMQALQKQGVLVASATEDFDFTTPMGEMHLTMMAAVGQWYSRNLAEETRKGHRARAAAGRQNGQLPYGYHAVDGVALPHEEQAEIVRWMFAVYSTGTASATEIAERLNRRGAEPPGRGRRKDARPVWTKDTVANLLQNKFYIGLVRYLRDWHQGSHEPIVSEDLFERVAHARQARTSRRLTAGRPTVRIYLCGGLARCSHCGNSMRATSGSYVRATGEKRLSYYTCDPRQRQTGCPTAHMTRADVADQQLGEYLCSLQLPPDWQQALIKRAQQYATNNAPDLQAIRKQRAALERQMEKLKKLYQLEDMSDEQYMTERQRLLTEIARLDQAVTGENPADLKKAAELLTNFAALWEEATPEERKALVRSIVQKVWLNESGLDLVEVKPAFKSLIS